MRWHPLSQAQYLETAYLLPGYILSSQGDRMAMANAVEGRFPFLDHRVVEMAARIPPSLKLRGLTEKYILRKAAGELVPPRMASVPSSPTARPDSASFFSASAPAYVERLLARPAVAKSGLFDPARGGKARGEGTERPGRRLPRQHRADRHSVDAALARSIRRRGTEHRSNLNHLAPESGVEGEEE